MTTEPATADVAVTIISSGERLLMVYNEKWDAFTFPMTKLHHWEHRAAPQAPRFEDWNDAAVRNVAETLGQTVVGKIPKLLDRLSDWKESGRDQVVRRYSFQVFHYRVPANTPLAWGVIGQWLGIAEIEDPNRHPISPTARFVLQQCLAEAAGSGISFFEL